MCEDDEVVVAVFDSAGYIGSVTSTSKEYARSTARQLRSGGRKVRCMTREEFTALQEQEDLERKQNIGDMREAFNVPH